MADAPWLKFYPQDWMGEPRLRACSLAARGLWMEMISLAHQATPYGHVLVNGNAPDTATLARMVGAGESECEALIEELDRNGVFSRTRKGVIYSRRMVKDAKKASHARNIGKKGGNPNLSNKKGNSSQDNPPDKGEDKPQKPEARSQKPDNPPGASHPSPPDDGQAELPDLPANLRSGPSDHRDVQAAFDAYNAVAERCGLPTAQKLNDSRRRKLARRLSDCAGLEGWYVALEKLESSPGLRGENDRGWRADLDFLCQDQSFTRLMEGFYDQWGSGAGSHAGGQGSGSAGTRQGAGGVSAALNRLMSG